MKIEITETQINKATGSSKWDCLNEVLYEMCRRMPGHESIDVAIAKIMIIGRTYAAAIERKRVVEDENDDFYIEKVGPAMCNGDLSKCLSRLDKHDEIDASNCKEIVSVHKQVNDIFKSVAGIEKRSLASKYLHFHFPKLFYIYDSRACASIRKITKPEKICHKMFADYDEEYAMFVLRCVKLQMHIKEKSSVSLSPRQIDKLLLSY